MQQTTLTSNSHSQQYINHVKRLQCQPSESRSSINSDEFSQADGERAMQEFQREIQERFKISIANKIYSFPRNIQSIDDLISSDEEDGNEDQQDSQWNQMLSKRIQRVQIKPQRVSNKKIDKDKDIEKGFKKKTLAFRDSQEKKKNQSDNFSSEKRPKSKKSAKKQLKTDTFRHEKQTTRSKRINTEPDHVVNYLDTLRPKGYKKNA